MHTRKIHIFIQLALIALTFNVSANEPIFKCKLNKNKQLILYKNTNSITYSFGKIGFKPELELSRKKEQIDIDLENLSGRYATNSIEFTNGKFSYKITTGVDRIANEQKPSTSLTVIENNIELTTLQCIKGSEEGSLLNIND
ncbi:hypothetical protein [Pantoea sp. R13S299]|uniref:hypothetical protein n=1 Tax=Pantoea sp. R13S299 TaxID=3402751 RepID=UPI003ADEE13B